MKNKKITEILDESIRQELLVSDFYGLFETIFREDREFWYTLSQEELNHSAILQAERDEFYEAGLLPEELVLANSETLQKQNHLLSDFLEILKISPPSIEQAFSIGFCLEGAITETVFRSCLEEYPETRALRIFQFLVGEERAHIERILEYASNMEICIEKTASLETLVASFRHGAVSKDSNHLI
jgi:hypothetical protein